MSKKYYLTEIRISVLSENEPITDDWELHNIAHEIMYGDCSGEWAVVHSQELTAKEAAIALIEQGSDPQFFGLDEEGNSDDE